MPKDPRKQLSGAAKRRRKREKEAVSASFEIPSGSDFAALKVAGEDAADIIGEAIAFQRLCMHRAVEAEPAEGARLERAARIAQGLVKSADPARAIREQAETIQRLTAVLDGLKDADDALPLPGGDARAGSSTLS